jgi:putative nucleotidyltransferase with HDIG domain
MNLDTVDKIGNTEPMKTPDFSESRDFPAARQPNRIMRVVSSTKTSINQWREFRAQIREFEPLYLTKSAEIEAELNDYRLTVVSLSYKAEDIDAQIWDLYKQIQTEAPKLIKDTQRLPLTLRTRSSLQIMWAAWKGLLNKQDDLLGMLATAPQSLEFYNKMQLIRKRQQEDRVKQAENERKVAAARQKLEETIVEVSDRVTGVGQVTLGTKIIRFEDALNSWNEKLDDIREIEKTSSASTEEILTNLYKLEEAVREAPVASRWLSSTEYKFSKLMSQHDLLVTMGKTVIPKSEIARASVMLYEQAPKLWVNYDHEELNRVLQALDKFINYFEESVQHELEIAERRRPGITRALTIPSASQIENLPPLITLARSLVNAIDSRDRFMRGHSERVTQLTLQTARAINWRESDLEYLELAALLHDVGKLSVPESILAKLQPLTVEERKIIEKHPTYGANIIKPVESLSRIVPWVYHHQERWDGLGYPDHLSKRDIPLASSIISVAETYTVMTTGLPYRDATSRDEALEVIKQEAGKQFNPEVVDAFVSEADAANTDFLIAGEV